MNAITLRVTLRGPTTHHGSRFMVEDLTSGNRRTVPFNHGDASVVLGAVQRSGLVAETATLCPSGSEPAKGIYFVTAVYPS